MPNKCQGLAGLLFGHRFEEMFESKEFTGLTSEEVKILSQQIGEVESNYDGIARAWDEQTEKLSSLRDLGENARSRKFVLKCIMCTRCGMERQ